MENAESSSELANSFELVERSKLAVQFQKRIFNAEDQTTAYYLVAILSFRVSFNTKPTL